MMQIEIEYGNLYHICVIVVPGNRLVFLTDVEGILDGSRRLIPRLSPKQAQSLIAGGVVSGGMIPKVEACLRALPRVTSTHIIDGRKPGALAKCLGPAPVGTRIT